MINVKEAKQLIDENCCSLKVKMVSLLEANGSILAEPIYAVMDTPPFHQSAMDGYAVGIHDKLTYQIIGEIKAGDAESFVLHPGQAVKIFTGAPVPDTAQAMIPIEKVTVTQSVLTVQSVPKLEDNIRPIGEQIKKGELALEKGTELDAAAIGFLAALGITTVPVYKKPSVGIVVTGNE